VKKLNENSGSKITGLDVIRKFPEKMARPMLKKARKDLDAVHFMCAKLSHPRRVDRFA